MTMTFQNLYIPPPIVTLTFFNDQFQITSEQFSKQNTIFLLFDSALAILTKIIVIPLFIHPQEEPGSQKKQKSMIHLNLYDWCSVKYSPDLKIFFAVFSTFFEFEHHSYKFKFLVHYCFLWDPCLGMNSDLNFGQNSHCE